MVACDGVVRGTCAYARVKTTLFSASLSRLGVSPRLDPKNPIRSARVVSSVIRMMLGATAILLSTLPPMRSRHTNHCTKRIGLGMKSSTISFPVARSHCAWSEQQLKKATCPRAGGFDNESRYFLEDHLQAKF